MIGPQPIDTTWKPEEISRALWDSLVNSIRYHDQSSGAVVDWLRGRTDGLAYGLYLLTGESEADILARARSEVAEVDAIGEQAEK